MRDDSRWCGTIAHCLLARLEIFVHIGTALKDGRLIRNNFSRATLRPLPTLVDLEEEPRRGQDEASSMWIEYQLC